MFSLCDWKRTVFGHDLPKGCVVQAGGLVCGFVCTGVEVSGKKFDWSEGWIRISAWSHVGFEFSVLSEDWIGFSGWSLVGFEFSVWFENWTGSSAWSYVRFENSVWLLYDLNFPLDLKHDWNFQTERMSHLNYKFNKMDLLFLLVHCVSGEFWEALAFLFSANGFESTYAYSIVFSLRL